MRWTTVGGEVTLDWCCPSTFIPAWTPESIYCKM